MLHNLRLLHVNKMPKMGHYRNGMKCWNWLCSHCGAENLTEPRCLRWGFHHFNVTAQWARCHQSAFCVGFSTWCPLGESKEWSVYHLPKRNAQANCFRNVNTSPDLLNNRKWPSLSTRKNSSWGRIVVLVAKACAMSQHQVEMRQGFCLWATFTLLYFPQFCRRLLKRSCDTGEKRGQSEEKAAQTKNELQSKS